MWTAKFRAQSSLIHFIKSNFGHWFCKDQNSLCAQSIHTRIDFISGFLAVVVVESRIIFSSLSVKNAHIWEIDFDEINLEMIQTSEQPKIFSFNGPSFNMN